MMSFDRASNPGRRPRSRVAPGALRADLAASTLFLLLPLLLQACGGSGGAGGSGQPALESPAVVRHWNEIAIDASGIDHRGAYEQRGPTRSSRAIAIVQVAVFDAVNAIVGRYEDYTGQPPAPSGASMHAAIARASRDTLVALFPAQSATFDAQLAADLAAEPTGAARDAGENVGRRAAAAILALRSDDGSGQPDPVLGENWFENPLPGHWRRDPVGRSGLALGALWSDVTPFALDRGDQFRLPPPPALGSPEYAEAFDEVRRLGGDGRVAPTERTEEQTFVGIYWAYDGMPSLCAPPRLYNLVALRIAEEMGSDVVELARMLALLNVSLADTAIAVWDSKYHHDFWRPVTGIREADAGTGPSGLGDGNPATRGDPDFTPLGAPASNSAGPDFTPPFPAYPSGHAGFGGALFQTLRNVYGTDDIAFTFVSEEFDGRTRDASGEARPLRPRSFTSLSQAEEENGQSRIYLGIHWRFDKTAGIAQGRQVADHVFARLFRPR